MTAELVLAGIEGGSWDRVEETMTLPRYQALWRARSGRGPKPGGFSELVRFLGADPDRPGSAILR